MEAVDLARTRRCACGNLRRTTRALTQFYDEILQPSGVRITQFSLLANIARAGSITVTQLGEMLVMDQTTVTHSLRLLEKQGWVRRTVGKDKRTRYLTLTEQGEAALGRALPYWEQAQTQVVERFGSERFVTLLKELSALAELN
jgi:DNA-binding MarR family transcriptional regulator